jgi:hypothetical protein
MLWASESRKADIVGAYGTRRGNRTVQSVPIPRRPTAPDRVPVRESQGLAVGTIVLCAKSVTCHRRPK